MRLWLLVLVVALPTAAQAPARVQIIHNAPDPALATVDVYLNETRTEALDDFAFRTATPYLPVEAGRVVTVVVAADTSTGIGRGLAVGAFVAEAGVDHQVIIEGLAQPFSFEGVPDPGSKRLAARVIRRGPANVQIGGGARIEMAFTHGAPDMPSYGFDVRSWTGAGIFGLRAEYGDLTRASFPGSDVHYRFRMPGQPETDLDAVRMDVHAGQSALLMLSGFFDPQTAPDGRALGYFVVREDGAVESVWGDAYSTPGESRPEASGRSAVTVSPNPATVRAAVELPEPGSAVEVFDVRGRRMVTDRAPGPRFQFETGQWPAGVYVVRVTSRDGAVSTARFTVTR